MVLRTVVLYSVGCVIVIRMELFTSVSAIIPCLNKYFYSID